MKKQFISFVAMAVLFLSAQIKAQAQNSFPPTGDAVIASPASSPANSRLIIGGSGDAKVSLDANSTASAIGFNRNVMSGGIFKSSISAWQFTATDGSFNLEGYNGAPTLGFSVLKNGNMGIGTTPTAPLDVLGTSATLAKIRTTAAANSWLSVANNYGTVNLGMGGSTNPNSYLWSSTGKIFLGADFNPAVYVDHSTAGAGKVGINVNPLDVFHVHTTNYLSGIYMDMQNTGTNNAGFVKFYPPNFTAGAYNSIVMGVDAGIIYGDNTLGVNGGTGGFVIAPWRNDGKKGLRMDKSGNVGIGTTLANNPNGYMLAVNGKIGAKFVQVEVSSTTWADYVFEKDYKLLSLSEVEKYINANKHLPEVPSATEVEKDGIDVASMNSILLRKIEELTLYMIEMKKDNETMKNKVNAMEKQLLK